MQTRLHEVGFRRPLVMGCDRRAIIILALLTGLSVYSLTIVGAVYGVLLWFPFIIVLRKWGALDPMYVYGLERNVRRYGLIPQRCYPARRSPTAPESFWIRRRRSIRFRTFRPRIYI